MFNIWIKSVTANQVMVATVKLASDHCNLTTRNPWFWGFIVSGNTPSKK
jgi:hypothetical protein